MLAVAIIAFVVVLIGAPVIFVNRDVMWRRARRRRQRRNASLPFLFFPTSGSRKPIPARNAGALSPRQNAATTDDAPPLDMHMPLRPEPGIADLPAPKPRGQDRPDVGMADDVLAESEMPPRAEVRVTRPPRGD